MIAAGLGELDKSGIAELTFKGRGITLSRTVRAGVNVHRFAAQKADQRLVIRPREFDRETGRRGDRRDDRDPGGERFLRHLKGDATAEKKTQFA